MFRFIEAKYVCLFLMLALLSNIVEGCSTSNPATMPSETPLPSITATSTIQPTQTSTTTPSPTSTPTVTPDPNIAPTLLSVAAGLIMHGSQDQNRVALTFDACEVPGQPAGFDMGIINVLNERGTKATFFLGGLWMENHPDAARLLGSNPLFEIGNHSFSHPDFSQISPAEMNLEIEQTQDIAWRLTGHVPKVFRFPFGNYDYASLQAVADHGLSAIQWDVETGDPDLNIDAETMFGYVKAQVKNGSIIIMHVNGRGWHSAEALPMVIDWLRSQGYELVTISELLNENK